MQNKYRAREMRMSPSIALGWISNTCVASIFTTSFQTDLNTEGSDSDALDASLSVQIWFRWCYI